LTRLDKTRIPNNAVGNTNYINKSEII